MATRPAATERTVTLSVNIYYSAYPTTPYGTVQEHTLTIIEVDCTLSPTPAPAADLVVFANDPNPTDIYTTFTDFT